MKSPKETEASVSHFRFSSAKIRVRMPLQTSQRVSGDFTWNPSSEQLGAANVGRLARALGCDGYAELHVVVDRRARPVLARGRGRSRHPALPELGRRARRIARDRVDDVVRRRAAERRRRLRAPLGARDAGPRGGGVGARGGRAAFADLGRAVARGSTAGAGVARARGSRGRRGRDVPSDVAGGRDRLSRVCAHRSGPGADLLRLRRSGRLDAPGGRRSASSWSRRMRPSGEAASSR